MGGISNIPQPHAAAAAAAADLRRQVPGKGNPIVLGSALEAEMPPYLDQYHVFAVFGEGMNIFIPEDRHLLSDENST